MLFVLECSNCYSHYRQKNILYDKAFYIVDNRQSLHFKQLFESIKFFEFNDLHHEHVSYGTLNDGKGITLINRQAGRLLAKLETLLPDED